jgi:hypothetical protein
MKLVDAMVNRLRVLAVRLPSDPLAAYRRGVEDTAVVLAQHVIKSLSAEAFEDLGWAFAEASQKDVRP